MISRDAASLLDGRAKGQFPISVATSLALEGLYGILEDKTETPAPAERFQELWINVRTLFRNLTGSLKSSDVDELTASDFAAALIEELTLIRSIIEDRSGGRLRVQGYVATYKSLPNLHSYAIVKPARTPKQQHHAQLENDAIQLMLKDLGNPNDHVKVVDLTIEIDRKAVALITHYPFDLLNVKGETDLVLVESHTGAIKGKAQWYTKLNGGKGMPDMPFNVLTIQVFGDTGGLFSPQPPENQHKLRDLAARYHWSQITTKDRIMQCVALLHDPIFEGNIRKWFR